MTHSKCVSVSVSAETLLSACSFFFCCARYVSGHQPLGSVCGPQPITAWGACMLGGLYKNVATSYEIVSMWDHQKRVHFEPGRRGQFWILRLQTATDEFTQCFKIKTFQKFRISHFVTIAQVPCENGHHFNRHIHTSILSAAIYSLVLCGFGAQEMSLPWASKAELLVRLCTNPVYLDWQTTVQPQTQH